jgi:membrane protein YdbS with pleckstrin-like domain
MNIAHSQTRDRFPLSTKKIVKKTFSTSLGLVIVLLVMSGGVVFTLSAAQTLPFFSSYIPLVSLISVILMVCSILYQYVYQYLYFQSYYYELTEHFVVIRKGVIAAREITIPYQRVQDIYMDQDILDRMFGLYDVHLSTATVSSGFEAHIDGLEQAAATGLRDVLLSTVRRNMQQGGQQAPVPQSSVPPVLVTQTPVPQTTPPIPNP